nr:DNA (cytosine-5-)-methyltransferase [uncultured Treponema sp.]
MIEEETRFTFIDLFAGIGGFHLAMKKLGGKCVFASELKEDLRVLYKENFEIDCFGDINEVDIEKEIPQKFDMLCAGFPCQPFSKAGKQQGFNDEKDRGNLFWKIMEILEAKKPEYILLENVQNLQTHDNGNTWEVIRTNLERLYDVKPAIISPHNFGIPQHRKRIYIAGRLWDKGGLKDFEFPPHEEKLECNIKQIISEDDNSDFMSLRDQTRMHLKAWQDFLDLLTKNKIPIPSFPIWAMEWGADYNYEKTPPCRQYKKSLEGKRGKFGTILTGNSVDDMLLQLPIYAQTVMKPDEEFPEWKKNYIKWNRDFYIKHKAILDTWLPEIQREGFENSHQKFEWNCGKDKKAKPILEDKIIQFRPSGIRVKLPTYSPALVLTTTQIPIFPWVKTPDGKKGRYMTKKEAAKLQGMEELKNFPNTIAEAFRAFGNAVNVEVVRLIAERLLEIK